jgi:hypothetical protein
MAHWGRVGNHHGIEPDTMMSCVDVPNPGREGAFTCVLPEPWRCMALAGKLNIFPLSTIIRVSLRHRSRSLAPCRCDTGR